MREHYLQECEQLRQDCLYTAETHHVLANRNGHLITLFQIIPATVAALAGLLVAGQIVPLWWAWVSGVSAVVVAVGSVLNPRKQYDDHLLAAKDFVVLKHEARSLKDTFSHPMKDEELCEEVKRLRVKYSELVRLSPPTADWAFEKAREKIKNGRHDLD